MRLVELAALKMHHMYRATNHHVYSTLKAPPKKQPTLTHLQSTVEVLSVPCRKTMLVNFVAPKLSALGV